MLYFNAQKDAFGENVLMIINSILRPSR